MALCSCGSDESNESQGIYGKKGKKLVRMAKFESGVEDDLRTPYNLTSVYSISYDDKERINCIYLRSDESYKKILEFDYDLKLVTFNKSHIPFTVNDKGVVTQFSYYTFTYDQRGFLTNIEKDKNYLSIWSLTYQDDDLQYFLARTVGLYYYDQFTQHYDCHYEDDINTGETNFYLDQIVYRAEQGGNLEKYPFTFTINYNKEIQDILIILYQAGYFGRLTERFRNTVNTNNKTATVSQLREVYHYYYHESTIKHIRQLKYTFAYE